MAAITYTDKDKTASDGIVNKWRDVDANEVKTVVNSKADSSDLTSHTGDTSNPHSVTKTQVGLGNVDNTADTAKPVSTAQQTALDAKLAHTNAATALTDAASMALTAAKHTLASSSATRTFTITYAGDDITLEVTLSATSATYTFPATALCVSEGVASGDNTLSLSGVSGDKYIIGIKKIGSAYYVASKNFGQ